jgi:hypothetical protein
MKKIILFLILSCCMPVLAQSTRAKADEDAQKYHLAYMIGVDSANKCNDFYPNDEYRYSKTGLTILEAHYRNNPYLNSKTITSYDTAERVQRVWSIHEYGISDKQNSYNAKNLLVKEVTTSIGSEAQYIDHKTLETTYDAQDRRIQVIKTSRRVNNTQAVDDSEKSISALMGLSLNKLDTIIYICEGDSICREHRLYMGELRTYGDSEVLKFDVQKRVVERRYQDLLLAHYSYMLNRMVYNQKGDCVEDITYIGAPLPENEYMSTRYEADEKGRTRWFKWCYDGKCDTTYYTYDSNDRVLIAKTYNQEGCTIRKNSYDSAGLLIQTQTCSEKSCTTTKYRYNAKGLLKSYLKQNEKGEILAHYAYRYGYWNERGTISDEREMTAPDYEDLEKH